MTAQQKRIEAVKKLKINLAELEEMETSLEESKARGTWEVNYTIKLI